jgi:hypothetical protein
MKRFLKARAIVCGLSDDSQTSLNYVSIRQWVFDLMAVHAMEL